MLPKLQTHYNGMCAACYIAHLEQETKRLSAFEEDNCALRSQRDYILAENANLKERLSKIRSQLKGIAED